MATLTQIKTAVNARLADLWPKFKARQETYRAAHGGNYWQGILWSSPPDDGALVTPDFDKAATDLFRIVSPATYDTDGNLLTPEVREALSWRVVGVNADLPATVECAARCDAYGDTNGPWGYYLTVLVTKSGITYGRTAHVRDGVEITTGTWEEAP